jgi:2-polyprenyl-3-methyl-5-hydroxy-6-metoxy-1,4-benzoquinol methylase
MSIIKRDYDNHYFENIFYQETKNSLRNQNRLRELKLHKSAGNLLEIGCGVGCLLDLAQKDFLISGIDISPYAISRAQEMLGAKVKAGNIESLPLPENHFDVVLAFNILEHLTTPQKSIQNIYQTLKPGGVLMGSVPNNFGLVGGLSTIVSNIFDRTHCSTYPTTKWHRLFRAQGYSKILFFGEITLGRNNCVYIKKPFWKYVSFNLMFICKK